MTDVLQISHDGDFLIGSYALSKHFDITLTTSPELGGKPEGSLSVLSTMVPRKQRKLYAKELSLTGEGLLKSGRAPLFTCFCGDLDCGVVTVAVTAKDDTVVWADFGMEDGMGRGFSQSDYMERTGPFVFVRSAYLKTLSGYR